MGVMVSARRAGSQRPDAAHEHQPGAGEQRTQCEFQGPAFSQRLAANGFRKSSRNRTRSNGTLSVTVQSGEAGSYRVRGDVIDCHIDGLPNLGIRIV